MSTTLLAAPSAQAAALFLHDLSLLEPELVRDDYAHLCSVWESILNHLAEPERLRVLLRSLLHGFEQRGASPAQQLLISALVLRGIRAAWAQPAPPSQESLWVTLCLEAVRATTAPVDFSRRLQFLPNGTVRPCY